MLLRTRWLALVLVCALAVPIVAAVAYSNMANATGYGDNETNSQLQSKIITINYCTKSNELVKRIVILPCDGNTYSGRITLRSFGNPDCVNVNVGAGSVPNTYVATATIMDEVINVDFVGTMLVIDITNRAGFSNGQSITIEGVVQYQTCSNVCFFP